MIKQQLTP